jgi:hypothetical protein
LWKVAWKISYTSLKYIRKSSLLSTMNQEMSFILTKFSIIFFYLTLIDTEEGHLLIENFVNIFFIASLSVSLHNLLDFYNLFCLCCIVMSRRSVTHYPYSNNELISNRFAVFDTCTHIFTYLWNRLLIDFYLCVYFDLT